MDSIQTVSTSENGPKTLQATRKGHPYKKIMDVFASATGAMVSKQTLEMKSTSWRMALLVWVSG